MNLDELLAQAADLSELSDDELTELNENLAAASDELLEGDPTDQALDDVERVATAVESIRTEQGVRAEAAETRAERAATLADRIHGEPESAEGGEGGEGGDGGDGGDGANGADGGDGGDAGNAEGTEGDGEGASSGDTAGSEGDDEDTEGESERIAAAAPPRLARTNARRPRSTRPRPSPAAVPQLSLTASANLPGIQAGQVLDTPDLIGQAFGEAIRASVGYAGPAMKVPIARVGAMNADEVFGPDRYLDGDKRRNAQKIDNVTSLSALTASGGICAPAETRYDLPILGGTEARPVRDGLTTRFGADRGGVRTLPPPILTDLDGAVSIWTEANDQDPSDPATKPCLTVTCPDEEETFVDAIVRCLKFGNFRARYFPEQVQAWVQLAGVEQAREAEIKALTAIGDGSTQVTAETVLGTTRTVLAVLDRALPQFRQRHRLDPNHPFRWGAPFWLRDQIRTDLARELPGSTDERLAMADAQIEAFFTMRHVNVTWLLEGETGQMYGAQGDGALLGWKSTVVTYLFPEGSWLFLDGGTLDLGIVRDSTLNSTNDFQMFAETFENVHFHGVESLRIVIDVCPDGSTSGTVDIDPCTTGS
jgi:hypothetical protein